SQGALAGMLLSELALGRREDLSKLLNPHRTNRKSGLGKLLSNSLEYPKNLLESRVIRPLGEKLRVEKEVNPIKMVPGEARVGSLNGKRIASSCNEKGEIKFLSARCTHMGGEVSFNNLEKTWDCSCHGSRFDLDGNVLCGPAKLPLEQISPTEKAASTPQESSPKESETQEQKVS
ncbi:MAG: Rieske 2Fe-2S domain-containing protein, partial [Bdellovibrionales bacterium]|nr:Rieske 2Fe-2S domain-containing protein [Bdellovibrionales bacterium]